jgi:hypothetical protein
VRGDGAQRAIVQAPSAKVDDEARRAKAVARMRKQRPGEAAAHLRASGASSAAWGQRAAGKGAESSSIAVRTCESTCSALPL